MTIAGTEVKAGILSQKWIKAAVIGSIWAAIEIIAGSFLHNLRVPFSGTILSMVAVFMLVAFSMHWPDRGIIIRAGIIAALMKSISPSAVIFGPMVAIFMEGVILEFIWLLLGRNLFGFILGGMLAVSWALVQKVLTLLLLYGFDLVKIADVFYQFLVIKTGLEEISPMYLVLLVIVLYYIAGMLAAVMGYFSYKRVQSKSYTSTAAVHIEQANDPFGNRQDEQKYTFVNLILLLLVLAASLYFLNVGMHIPALILGIGLITYVVIRYKRSIRNLKKVSIWIQVLLITLLATLLWEWINTGEFFTMNGFIIGLEINFRAMIIIFSFSAISVELRNPIVKSLLYRNGFANLYKAITLAFSSLPLIIERLPQSKSFFKKKKNTLGLIFNLAEDLLMYMDKEHVCHDNIFMITGKVHSGKSTYVNEFVAECRENKIDVSGFIASGTFKNNKRDSFHLTDISTGESFLLGSRTKKKNWIKHRDFYFNPDSFKRGEEILTDGLSRKTALIVLDELGPMELAGKGWSEALMLLDKNYDIIQVWVVRERIIKEVKDRWHIPERHIFSIESTTFKKLLSQIGKQQSKL